MKKLLIILALVLSTLFISGCFNRSDDEQAVPWGRPASWEDNAPGMGGF